MKVFQAIYGNIPRKVIPCLKSVRRFYPKVNVFHFGTVKNPINESDRFRVEYLKENDDILYVDWDVLLFKPIYTGGSNVPLVNYYKDAPDFSLIYSPKKEFWIDLDKKREKRGINSSTYGWVRKLLRGEKVNEIKTGFNHLRFTGMAVSNDI